MKKFLRDRTSVVHNGQSISDIQELEAIHFNQLRCNHQNEFLDRFDMMLLLHYNLDLYKSFDTLSVLVNFGILEKPKRGLYCFTKKPVYKTKLYKAYCVLRGRHLANSVYMSIEI